VKFEEFLAKQMKDPAFKERWEELDTPFQAGNLLIELRADFDLTQQQLADRAGVKRSYIARIENGNANPTVKSLSRILNSVGLRLVLSAEEPEAESKTPPKKSSPRRKTPRSSVAAAG